VTVRRGDGEVARHLRHPQRADQPPGRRHVPDVTDVLGLFQESGDFRDEGISALGASYRIWAVVAEAVRSALEGMTCAPISLNRFCDRIQANLVAKLLGIRGSCLYPMSSAFGSFLTSI
jgi:hypothetical protein